MSGIGTGRVKNIGIAVKVCRETLNEKKFKSFLYMNKQQNFRTFSLMIMYLFFRSLEIRNVTFSENFAYVLNG